MLINITLQVIDSKKKTVSHHENQRKLLAVRSDLLLSFLQFDS